MDFDFDGNEDFGADLPRGGRGRSRDRARRRFAVGFYFYFVCYLFD